MTISEAEKCKETIKITTKNGNTRIGNIEEILWKDAEEQEETEILFNSDEGGYSILESEILSIERA